MTQDSESRFDLDTVRARVDAVLGEALYWFPVRHHSPTVARYLDQIVRQRRPRVVFIEGPAEAGDLIPHLTDRNTKPPVAVYSSYRDDNNVLGLAGIASPSPDIPARFACWYPLLAYSPEYVAMQAALDVSAEVVFMDLPHHALIRPASAAPEGEQPKPPPKTASRPDSEHLLAESGFYRQLARAAGYRSWNETWDTLFETRPTGEDVEAFRRDLALFCAAARATTPAERIDRDGTRERERFMLKTIGDTLKRRKLSPDRAVVVCGGFHLFLDRDDPEPPPEPPAGTTYCTLVPYSYFRVSELSGYGAGNRAPQFYQLAWELASKKRGGDLVSEHVVAVLKHGRRAGEVLSSADAIAVCQHADLLARLRGRRAPVLDDLEDALFTCCCKGDPAEDGVPLRRSLDAVGIGTKIGQVTHTLGRLPILEDFYSQMSILELAEVLEKEVRLDVDLDRRQEMGQRRSAFLHRLRFLKVPLVELKESPSDVPGGQIFREKWALRWGPQVEPALLEQNLYGDTVESAALARLQEELAEDGLHAGAVCRRLVQAIDMDFPDLVREMQHACSQAIDTDPQLVSLAQALASLTVLERYAVYRNLRQEGLADLIVRCFDRACFAIPDVASAPEDQQGPIVQALLAVAELVQRAEREGIEKGHFAEHLRLAAGASTVPFLRGAFLGLLTEIRELSPEELAKEVSALARGPVEHRLTAGDFLDGIMAVSRTSILLGATALVGAVDELLRATEWEDFLVMLPRLRGAFERLHETQRDALAAHVAEHYGLSEKETVTELHTSVAAAALIAQIDREVARIMARWEL
jgi:hypothetical protein